MLKDLGSNSATFRAIKDIFNLDKKINRLSATISAERLNINTALDTVSLSKRNQLKDDLVTYERGSKNYTEGLSVLNEADSAISALQSTVVQMYSLAVSASDETLNSEQRAAYDAEAQNLKAEFDRIVEQAQYNDRSLFSDILANGLEIHGGKGNLGDSSYSLQEIGAGATDFLSFDLTTESSAELATTSIALDSQYLTLSKQAIGAYQNQADSARSLLDFSSANVKTTDVRLKDFDEAKELANLTRLQILQDTSRGFLAQANQNPATVENLLNSKEVDGAAK